MVIAFTLDKVSRIHSLFFILVVLGYIEDIFYFGKLLTFIDAFGASMIIICSVIIFILKFINYI